MSSSAAFSVQSLGPPPAIRSHWGLAEQSQDSSLSPLPIPVGKSASWGREHVLHRGNHSLSRPLIPFSLEGPWLLSGGPQHGPRTTQGFH